MSNIRVAKDAIPVGHIYVQIESLGDEAEYLVKWAERELIANCDVSSIVELAGYTKPIVRHELIETLRFNLRRMQTLGVVGVGSKGWN